MATAAIAARVLPLPAKKAIYANPTVARLIRSTLNRGAQAGVTMTSIAAGNLAGMKLYLDLQSEKDYWLGTYEPGLQTAICQFVKPGFVAYDVGAHIGYITLQLAKGVGPGGQVTAFEALPANLERLEKNLKLNDLKERVEVVSAAVVDRTGEVNFLIGPSIGTGKAEGSRGRNLDSDGGSLVVNGIAIDDFVFAHAKHPPDFIKIDIEGGEVLALQGMRRVLDEIRPILFLEVHGPEAAAGVWDILAEANYLMHRLEKGYPEVSRQGDLRWKEYLVALPLDR